MKCEKRTRPDSQPHNLRNEAFIRALQEEFGAKRVFNLTIPMRMPSANQILGGGLKRSLAAKHAAKDAFDQAMRGKGTPSS